MPGLLDEMRDDLLSDESQLVREFFVASDRHTIYRDGGTRRFRYYADEHRDLRNKLDLLAEGGFVICAGPGEIYRMTEVFVHLLTGKGIADTDY